MNRKISQQDLDAQIRSHLASAGAPEPASLGDVLYKLPDRLSAARRSLPAFPAFPRVARFAAVAVVLALVAAVVGVPLMMSSPAPVGPSRTGSPAPRVASPSPVVTQVATESPLAPGTFVQTGSMTSPRASASGILLANGLVLIAGGTDGNSNLAAAELYDPATGKFSPTGSMSIDQAGTATLLNDGRVLFAGGANSTGTIASADVYDPATGKFSSTGAMTVARSSHTATLLPNGRVLIAGGEDIHCMALAAAELYDPATGKFSQTGSMAVGRMVQSAALLPNVRVLIAGGVTTKRISDGTILTGPTLSAELYDPATGKFNSTGSMTELRSSPTTTLLSDGRVLIAGGVGFADNTSLTSAELYNPATGKFSLTGSMTSAQVLTTATLLSDGRVLIVGGVADSAPDSPLATTQLYDPRTGTFSVTGSMSMGRSGPTATLLPNGRVLIAGGVGGPRGAPLASAELYQP